MQRKSVLSTDEAEAPWRGLSLFHYENSRPDNRSLAPHRRPSDALRHPRLDPTLVRGLDYYTRTVFEVQVVEGMGSQNAIGGGGRYDKLMQEIGGTPCPGFGFALGYERCLLALQAAGFSFAAALDLDAYVACVDESVRSAAFPLVQALRDAGLSADMDHQGRSLKGQFKQAGKMGASHVVVVGPDEVACGVVTVRDMASHEETAVSLDALRDFAAQAAHRHADEDARGAFVEFMQRIAAGK